MAAPQPALSPSVQDGFCAPEVIASAHAQHQNDTPLVTANCWVNAGVELRVMVSVPRPESSLNAAKYSAPDPAGVTEPVVTAVLVAVLLLLAAGPPAATPV